MFNKPAERVSLHLSAVSEPGVFTFTPIALSAFSTLQDCHKRLVINSLGGSNCEKLILSLGNYITNFYYLINKLKRKGDHSLSDAVCNLLQFDFVNNFYFLIQPLILLPDKYYPPF